MSIDDNTKEAMTRFLVRRGVDAVSVADYEDEYSSRCDTCDWGMYTVDIIYINSKGEAASWVYDGSLSELVRELT